MITYEQKFKLIDEISKSILFNKTIMEAIKEDLARLEDLEN